jgi:hypothetical protein
MRQRTHQPQFAWLILILFNFVNFVSSFENLVGWRTIAIKFVCVT